MAADVGLGITIVFGTSGFSAELQDVNGASLSRDPIETSHQGTTSAKTFMPADLYDGGEVSFGIHFDPDADPPIDAVVEEVVITWPTGTTHTFQAFMTGYAPAAPLNDKMTGEVTLKVSGTIVIDPLGAGSGSGSFEV